MKEKLYKKVKLTWWEVNYDYSKRDDDGDWKTIKSCDRFDTEDEAQFGYEQRYDWMFKSYHIGEFIEGGVHSPVKKEVDHYEEVSEEEIRKMLEEKDG